MIVANEKDPHRAGFSGQSKQYDGLICNMLEYFWGNGEEFWNDH